MSEALLGINAVLAIVYLLVALLAGYGTGSIAFRHTIAEMQRTAKLCLVLLAALGLLAISQIALFLLFSTYSWWFVWDKALLFVPMISLPLTACAVYSRPKLMEIIRLQTAEPEVPANRTKRRIAAQAGLVVPIQTVTVGAIIHAAMILYPLPVQFQNELIILVASLASAAALLIWRQKARRRRIHRDDGTSAFHWMKRVSVYTMVCLLFTFAVIFSVSTAKSNKIVPIPDSLSQPANWSEITNVLSSYRSKPRIKTNSAARVSHAAGAMTGSFMLDIQISTAK
ncbi:hypothetical protein [Paenibacillus nasutitermitis]|uniref:Uncharacterized protein n=1 Tax=Paenibacillus nasutitermitis TaxID=1652958 RepID=A0A916YJY4_9BACL|nr:hypothetical protein [Paenibacillus nasutitermitis]GGD48861.1 hypothetical protein GCM10010911_02980 [Paenibacillus nasutitermitis]